MLFKAIIIINKMCRLSLEAQKTKFMVLSHKDGNEVNELKKGNVAIDRARKYLGCVIDERRTAIMPARSLPRRRSQSG